jgi:Protein of unknown function (DUF3997)
MKIKNKPILIMFLLMMFLLISIPFILIRCNVFMFHGNADYTYPVAGKYILVKSSANDVKIVPNSSYDANTPLIPSKVIEVAWNDKIIIAKQQGLKEKSKGSGYMIPDDSIINYWILDTKGLDIYGPDIYGPFDKEHFIKERKNLKISDSLELKPVESYNSPKE